MKSKCGWSPFHGEKLTGWPIATIVNGKKVFWNNKIVKNVYGKPIEFN
jgi:dihydroorotase